MSSAVAQSRASTHLCTSSRQPMLSWCPQARRQNIQIPASSLKITNTCSEARKHTECIPSYFKRVRDSLDSYAVQCRDLPWVTVTSVTAVEPILHEVFPLVPNRLAGRGNATEGWGRISFQTRAA